MSSQAGSRASFCAMSKGDGQYLARTRLSRTIQTGVITSHSTSTSMVILGAVWVLAIRPAGRLWLQICSNTHREDDCQREQEAGCDDSAHRYRARLIAIPSFC